MIEIVIKLFAIYREVCGTEQLNLQIPAGSKVQDVLTRVIQQYPELGQWREVTRFGVNLQFVDIDTVLQSGDELVFIPPVSGG